MPLSRDLKEFVGCLNSTEAEYLIVGALAVSWHGFPDTPGTSIFWFAPLRITPNV